MFVTNIYLKGLQKNARNAAEEGRRSHTAQNLSQDGITANVISLGNEMQKVTSKKEWHILLTELLLQEVCVNLSAYMHAVPLGFWLSFWQLHLVALIIPKKEKEKGELVRK